VIIGRVEGKARRHLLVVELDYLPNSDVCFSRDWTPFPNGGVWEGFTPHNCRRVHYKVADLMVEVIFRVFCCRRKPSLMRELYCGYVLSRMLYSESCRLYPFIFLDNKKEGPGNFSSGCSPHWVNHVFMCLYCVVYLLCFISAFFLFYFFVILFF
jgi:hypothetical protein